MSRAEVVREPSKEKVQERERLEKLLESHRSFILIDLHKSSTKLLNTIRRQVDELGIEVQGTKNALFRLALKETYPELTDEIDEFLDGPRLFVFSHERPIPVAIRLSKVEVPIKAKAGVNATSEIVVSKGNTGFPPGPVISVFANAGIPTKIMSGAIHITKTVTVAEEGDVISPQLAEVLNKLGMKPITARLRLVCGCDLEAAEIFDPETLIPDVEEILENLVRASEGALKLAVRLAYPNKLTTPILLAKAGAEARTVALAIGYVITETIPEFIALAAQRGRTLASAIEK